MVDWKDSFPKENRYFETENGILYKGDCLEILKEFPEKSISLVLTDPPYGINITKYNMGFGGKSFAKREVRKRYKDIWDKERPDKRIFDLLLKVSKHCMIFGGNYFADLLPLGTHWLFWDKLQTMPSFSDGELIWTNIKRNSVKKIVYEYNGLIGKEKKRFHPTQKPVGLIEKLLLDYSKENDLILDCFCGSGTTLVAAERLNRRYIGIELEEKYCEITKQRLIKETEHPKLF